ncbi:rbcG [Symbiodinium pilosum]|uniref:RbcG protein n=1 Tax=Symbiodinium pilosum TaxID=2952 RepID=A0A812XDM4_SYMPI|nr:rbcG [Symbiodinium pilosum]
MAAEECSLLFPVQPNTQAASKSLRTRPASTGDLPDGTSKAAMAKRRGSISDLGTVEDPEDRPMTQLAPAGKDAATDNLAVSPSQEEGPTMRHQATWSRTPLESQPAPTHFQADVNTEKTADGRPNLQPTPVGKALATENLSVGPRQQQGPTTKHPAPSTQTSIESSRPVSQADLSSRPVSQTDLSSRPVAKANLSTQKTADGYPNLQSTPAGTTSATENLKVSPRQQQGPTAKHPAPSTRTSIESSRPVSQADLSSRPVSQTDLSKADECPKMQRERPGMENLAASPSQEDGPAMKYQVSWSRTSLESSQAGTSQFQPVAEVTLKTTSGSAAASYNSMGQATGSTQPLMPPAILLKDGNKPREQKTVRFSDAVEQRDISPNPSRLSSDDDSAVHAESSKSAGAAKHPSKLTASPPTTRTTSMSAASSNASSAMPTVSGSKPAPVQSSTFSDFLVFLNEGEQPRDSPKPPSTNMTSQAAAIPVQSENGQHKQSLSNFLFMADNSAPVTGTSPDTQSNLHSPDAHHHQDVQQGHSSVAESHQHSTGHDGRPAKKHGKHDKQGKKSRKGSSSTRTSTSSGGGDSSSTASGDIGKAYGEPDHVSSSSPANREPVEVTEEFARKMHERGLAPSLQERVLKRAYFLFENGESDDSERNYFKALRIELSK